MTKRPAFVVATLSGIGLVTAAVLTLLPAPDASSTTIDAKPFAELPDGRGGLNVEAIADREFKMVLGIDKNVYVEPAIWTIEWARNHYDYPVTRSN